MWVAGQKTQALVLSKWSGDAVNLTARVAGETVVTGDRLNLLGVTLDRILHSEPHCRNLQGVPKVLQHLSCFV